MFDLSYLSHMPNMTVLAPNTTEELFDAVDYALSLNSPVAIRYPKNQRVEQTFLSLKDGLWKEISLGKKANIVAVGPTMLNIANQCAKSISGVGVISARVVKPLDEKMLLKIKDTPLIVLEENSTIGGLGSMITLFYSNNKVQTKVLCLGVEDAFVKHGSVDEQLINIRLDCQSVIRKILDFIE